MSKIPFRNINIGVNVAEHTRRNEQNNSNSNNYSSNRSRYQDSEKNNYAKRKRGGNIYNIIPVIILFVVIYILYKVFQ